MQEILDIHIPATTELSILDHCAVDVLDPVHQLGTGVSDMGGEIVGVIEQAVYCFHVRNSLYRLVLISDV